jgi:hypothetical protein
MQCRMGWRRTMRTLAGELRSARRRRLCSSGSPPVPPGHGRWTAQHPASFVVFDVLAAERTDLRSGPFENDGQR